MIIVSRKKSYSQININSISLVEVKYEKNPQYIYKITNQIIKHRDYSDI